MRPIRGWVIVTPTGAALRDFDGNPMLYARKVDALDTANYHGTGNKVARAKITVEARP